MSYNVPEYAMFGSGKICDVRSLPLPNMGVATSGSETAYSVLGVVAYCLFSAINFRPVGESAGIMEAFLHFGQASYLVVNLQIE